MHRSKLCASVFGTFVLFAAPPAHPCSCICGGRALETDTEALARVQHGLSQSQVVFLGRVVRVEPDPHRPTDLPADYAEVSSPEILLLRDCAEVLFITKGNTLHRAKGEWCGDTRGRRPVRARRCVMTVTRQIRGHDAPDEHFARQDGRSVRR